MSAIDVKLEISKVIQQALRETVAAMSREVQDAIAALRHVMELEKLASPGPWTDRCLEEATEADIQLVVAMRAALPALAVLLVEAPAVQP